jgi:hypothetical protein
MSTVSDASEPKRFSDNMEILVDAVHDCVTKLHNGGYKTINPIFVLLVKQIIGSYDKNRLINGFITNSHKKCWENIKNRDEIFFSENSSEIFKELPMDKVNLFKDLFTTKDRNGVSVISDELKTQIWTIISAMVKISIKHVHKGRRPYSIGGDNIYEVNFHPEVDVDYHSSLWGIKLDFPEKC